MLQWQTVFSSVLNIPKQVKIPVPATSIKLSKSRKFIEDNEIESWIKKTAYFLTKVRTAKYHLQKVEEILKSSESSEEDRLKDWYNATAHFASEVINGNIDFVSQLNPISYKRLEAVWLKDVKELDAYLIWEEKQGNAEDNYYEACSNIRHRLLFSNKGSLEDFINVKEYLLKRYLTDGKIVATRNKFAHELVSNKAKRVWETTGRDNQVLNWSAAEEYVKKFYENIIPAVEEKSIDHTLEVLKAFSFSKAPENRYLIINCFEAVIAICFINLNNLNDIIQGKLIDLDIVL